MGSVVVQLGVGGIFAILILQLVLGFLEKWRERQAGDSLVGTGRGGEDDEAGSGSCPVERYEVDVQLMARRVDDLWEWHSVRNPDGVFVWYVRSSLEDAIVKLADNIEAQTEVMRGLGMQVRDSGMRMERLERAAEKERGKGQG